MRRLGWLLVAIAAGFIAWLGWSRLRSQQSPRSDGWATDSPDSPDAWPSPQAQTAPVPVVESASESAPPESTKKASNSAAKKATKKTATKKTTAKKKTTATKKVKKTVKNTESTD